jgi:hypothetical protein
MEPALDHKKICSGCAHLDSLVGLCLDFLKIFFLIECQSLIKRIIIEALQHQEKAEIILTGIIKLNKLESNSSSKYIT